MYTLLSSHENNIIPYTFSGKLDLSHFLNKTQVVTAHINANPIRHPVITHRIVSEKKNEEEEEYSFNNVCFFILNISIICQRKIQQVRGVTPGLVLVFLVPSSSSFSTEKWSRNQLFSPQ